jgi:hypothetical protein
MEVMAVTAEAAEILESVVFLVSALIQEAVFVDLG